MSQWKCRMPYTKWPRKPRAGRIAGITCILIAVLLLLLCAPGWLIALIAASLLFTLGMFLLFGLRWNDFFR